MCKKKEEKSHPILNNNEFIAIQNLNFDRFSLLPAIIVLIVILLLKIVVYNFNYVLKNIFFLLIN